MTLGPRTRLEENAPLAPVRMERDSAQEVIGTPVPFSLPDRHALRGAAR